MKVLKFVVGVALAFCGASTIAADVASAAERRADLAVIDVRPRMAFAGNGGRILVRVPAHADNRRLRVEISSRSFAGVGEVALDGLATQDAYWFNLPALPAGYYLIKATVYGANGPLASVTNSISRQ